VKWVTTNGRRPRTGDRPLLVKFRNGLESKKSYTADQLRWSQINNDPWDIVEVARP
jgi:hypothetical protein